MKRCWWHKWIFDGETPVLHPMEGPFDPRSDKDRTWNCWRHVCAKCGAVKISEIEYDGL